MSKSICRSILALVLGLLPVTAQAQGQGFPATIRVLWDMNADVDEVIFYSVSIDTSFIPITVQAGDCVVATRTCSTQLVINDNSLHTIAVNATNQWGTSDASIVTFRVNNPKKPTNVRIG